MKRKLKLLVPLIIVIFVVLSLLVIIAALLVVNASRQSAVSRLPEMVKWVSNAGLTFWGSAVLISGQGSYGT